MTEQPILKTERLLLRPFSLRDAARIRQLADSREIAKNTATMPYPYEEGMAEAWIATHQDLFDRGENVHFAICLAGTGDLIGAMGITISRDHDCGELGYWIGIPYWDQGYCTEAATAAVRFGFETLKLNRIEASHFMRNPASGRVLEKIGMRFEGIRRQGMKRWGTYVDVAIYGILRKEYPSEHETD